MKTKKERESQVTQKKRRGAGGRRQEKAYGDASPLCLNAECIMRKRTKCLGFEGCPGFKGR